MPSARALALLVLTLGLPLAAPAGAFAAEDPGDEPEVMFDAVGPEDEDFSGDESTDGEPGAPAAAAPGADPFCPADPAEDTEEGVDAAEADPAPIAADIPDPDVADAPIDLESILDFCSTGAVAPRTASLGVALRRGRVDPGTMNVSVPGTLVRELQLAPGRTPKALRRYRSATLGTARRVVASDGFVDLPVTLSPKGRKALRAAGREARVTVTTTLRLASGERRTRTQVLVLRRGR